MKKLSNAELRTLFVRRSVLAQIVQNAALQTSSNLGSNWERELSRMKSLRQEVGDITQDPQFDRLVPTPEVAKPNSYAYSPSGTMLNVVATGRELIAYLDTILNLHLTPKSEQLRNSPRASAKVFIGHGRNTLVRQRVKDFIQQCGLEPIILEEQASSGMTVVEKLEKYGRLSDYAVLIFTADDLTEDGSVRARQNVVQELGWFQGVLGRDRTAILRESRVEIPSNIAGVVYLEFQSNHVETTFESLRSEFEEAGIVAHDP